MAGLTARVRLVSNALLLLGGSTIASLEGNSTGAILGSNLFENTYLSMLESHRWGFAKKTQELARLSTTPISRFQYAFAIPNDFLYTVQGSSRDFEIFGTEIHSNDLTFTLTYVSTIEEDKLPAYFAKALEFNLASLFAIPLTGDLEKGSYYSKVYVDHIKKAKFADSTQYPETAVQDSPYVDVRY